MEGTFVVGFVSISVYLRQGLLDVFQHFIFSNSAIPHLFSELSVKSQGRGAVYQRMVVVGERPISLKRMYLRLLPN